MLEKLAILFLKAWLVNKGESLAKTGFLMIFVTLTRLEAFGNKYRAGFVNYGKKWPQDHHFSSVLTKKR